MLLTADASQGGFPPASVPGIAARLGVPEDDARKKLRRALVRMLQQTAARALVRQAAAAGA